MAFQISGELDSEAAGAQNVVIQYFRFPANGLHVGDNIFDNPISVAVLPTDLNSNGKVDVRIDAPAGPTLTDGENVVFIASGVTNFTSWGTHVAAATVREIVLGQATSWDSDEMHWNGQAIWS